MVNHFLVYHAPECEIEEFHVGVIICTSPDDGAIEDIDYEDLVI